MGSWLIRPQDEARDVPSLRINNWPYQMSGSPTPTTEAWSHTAARTSAQPRSLSPRRTWCSWRLPTATGPRRQSSTASTGPWPTAATTPKTSTSTVQAGFVGKLPTPCQWAHTCVWAAVLETHMLRCRYSVHRGHRAMGGCLDCGEPLERGRRDNMRHWVWPAWCKGRVYNARIPVSGSILFLHSFFRKHYYTECFQKSNFWHNIKSPALPVRFKQNGYISNT